MLVLECVCVCVRVCAAQHSARLLTPSLSCAEMLKEKKVTAVTSVLVSKNGLAKT